MGGDLWSCGVVIYVMLSGYLPFGDNAEMIVSGEGPDFSAEVWRNVPSEAIDLTQKLITHDIRTRWTATMALQHEWLKVGLASPVNTSVLPGPSHVAELRATDSFGNLSQEQRWD